jgi:hypothetical protein
MAQVKMARASNGLTEKGEWNLVGEFYQWRMAKTCHQIQVRTSGWTWEVHQTDALKMHSQLRDFECINLAESKEYWSKRWLWKRTHTNTATAQMILSNFVLFCNRPLHLLAHNVRPPCPPKSTSSCHGCALPVAYLYSQQHQDWATPLAQARWAWEQRRVPLRVLVHESAFSGQLFGDDDSEEGGSCPSRSNWW